MQRSTLGLYMQKVAEGDTSFAGRLCAQLADRLIYIPTKAQAKTAQAVKVSIVRLFEDGMYIVPVFTTEKKLRDWATQRGRSVDSISLLGADFCSALDGETSLAVDPGSEPNVKLAPNFVREISMSGGSGDYGEIASSVAARVNTPQPASPVATPVVPSSITSFPTTPVAEVAGVPQPDPQPRAVRKEEFPPFVPPLGQPTEPQKQPSRLVEQREPPIGETIRAHRSSLAAGVLMGPDEDRVDHSRGVPSENRAARGPDEVSAEPSSEKKKRSLLGLFSKK